MSRTFSIGSSFFAASFIVLMSLGLLAWGGSAAFAAEPLGEDCSNDCQFHDGEPCVGGDPCDDNCDCYCDPNCGCNEDC